MKDKTQVTHSLGATFSAVPFWLGLGILLLGLVAFFQIDNLIPKYILVALSAILGVTFILSFQILVVDGNNKTATKYFTVGFLKGPLEKSDLKNFQQLSLILFRENQTMNMTSISTTVRTRSYDIYIGNSESRIVLAEITDYDKALKFIKDVSTVLEIPYEDKYELLLKSAQEKRRQREALRN